ncbi:hypothetical protein OG884_10780 [Streptosporangium sp. NBC_01755]|uniref:hypothetical protein n=1 Tax=unclassified Streptosporangium TaxID=2632669 RepID=UPI002DD94B4A|nr:MULTISPECIES: hypothetical protein [unclassified Streptosporangium]WSA26210.1 hypothetical protein OIE13_35905 [Streptosporangium sp. NBC_01810]WSD02362.1 hypothetical protein OG884_10780 [Streptosporangium sp. NBC_01755]
MRRLHRVRRNLNYINLSTPLGLLLARLGRARVSAGPDGLILAYGYRFRFPIASAFTVGNVVLTKHGEGFLTGALLRHEDRHASQYMLCVGLPMLPLYVVAVAVSILICGNQASWNLFERLANLEDGNYARRSPWWFRTKSS